MMNKNLSRYVDLAFCLVLLPAMIMLLPLDKWLDNNVLFVVLLLAGLYSIYWVNRLFTVPMLFASKRRFAVPIMIFTASIFVVYLLSQYKLEDDRMPPRNEPAKSEQSINGHNQMKRVDQGEIYMRKLRRGPSPQTRLQQQAVWFLFFVVTSFSFVVSLLSELYRQSMYRQSVEFEKKKAELALYKAQINPHFLFNTLNTLLGMVITKSEKTEEAFVQFATLMRYMYSNSDKDMIPLQTELEYITQYVDLQRYRLNENTTINVSLCDEAEASKYKIAPMLLITFVENALKYGVSPHEKSNITIEVSLDGEIMRLMVQNPIFESRSKGKGIGITNCKSRLELLYHGDYTLIIDPSESNYYVSLTIKLS